MQSGPGFICRFICAATVFLTALTFVLPGNAQASRPAEAPADVSFTIRFKTGKTQFYQGELITIEMLFSSKTSGVYQLAGATYDRSGRFGMDSFHVEPSNGVADPTAEYFNSIPMAFSGGGLSPMGIILSEKPYVIERDLNELVRFDQPGHYRLYVTNQRVGKPVMQGRTRSVQWFQVASNTIEFDVVKPDPNWQAQQIQEASAAIAKGHDDHLTCRTLRFMNSAAAETEMIRLYSSACGFDFELGLVGSPRRAAIIEAMETQLAAPDYAVAGGFIHTLSSLRFMREHPEPLPYEVTDDPERLKALRALGQKRRDDYEEILMHYARQLAATVSRKTRSARAISLDTLLSIDNSFRNQKSGESNLAVDQLIASLPDLFFELPRDRQNTLLGSLWPRLRSPAMLPVLRQLLVEPAKPADARNDLRSIALRRLYELSPDEGRNLILREMKIVPHRVDERVLQILPDTELAEVDQMLTDALAKTKEPDFTVVADYADLIARYATANSLARVKTAIDDKIGTMACAPQTSLLIYFLRTDPDYGAAALERALGARGEGRSGCYRMTFEDLGRRYMSPAIETSALQHLDDPDRNVAIQAIELLRQKGSAKAEKPLLDRLERWHTEWQTRADEVQPQIANGMVAGEPMNFELQLARTLVSATAWTLDAEQLKHIEDLCLTPNGREAVQAAIKTVNDRTIDVSMWLSDDFHLNVTLGNYQTDSIEQLKIKLSTMPKDSHFVWKCFAQDPQAGTRLFQELKNFLAERGMTLDKPDEKSKETP
ncbi:MAG TPA: hypothetical protein VE961_28335 [Pyrinomonadaceae bacterium]|nr:hypothetical protein [Pyrinomonadaceae bacterium]